MNTAFKRYFPTLTANRMIGDNVIYIGVRHWTHEAALIREFQRYWNR